MASVLDILFRIAHDRSHSPDRGSVKDQTDFYHHRLLLGRGTKAFWRKLRKRTADQIYKSWYPSALSWHKVRLCALHTFCMRHCTLCSSNLNYDTILTIHLFATCIRWHFIGPASSMSNVKTVLKCRNLFMVETLQSIKVANLMNDHLKRSKRKEKLNVMVQSRF